MELCRRFECGLKNSDSNAESLKPLESLREAGRSIRLEFEDPAALNIAASEAMCLRPRGHVMGGWLRASLEARIAIIPIRGYRQSSSRLPRTKLIEAIIINKDNCE
jgi:hypothetical protein